MSHNDDQPIFGKRASPVEPRPNQYTDHTKGLSLPRTSWLEPALIIFIVTLLLATFSFVI